MGSQVEISSLTSSQENPVYFFNSIFIWAKDLLTNNWNQRHKIVVRLRAHEYFNRMA